MFTSLQIKGFRGFSNLRIDEISRFALLIGRNNVGKTAILESLFLILGPTNPSLTLTLSSFRGIDQFKQEAEDLWGWIFHRKDLSQSIEIRVNLEDARTRSLRVSISDKTVIASGGNKRRKGFRKMTAGTASTRSGPGQLVLEYQDECGRISTTKAIPGERGIVIDKNNQTRFPNSIFVSARGGYASDNAERYSALEEIGEEQIILDSLKCVEPRLKKLSVLVGAAGPMVHADIGIGRMIPLPLMGDGIGRLLTLLLSIVASKDGAVLIDEIETGIHYSAMETIWTLVARVARKYGTQLFASTHSFECLSAAHAAFKKEGTKDLNVHRIDRIADGVVARTFDHDMVETALISGIEMR